MKNRLYFLSVACWLALIFFVLLPGVLTAGPHRPPAVKKTSKLVGDVGDETPGERILVKYKTGKYRSPSEESLCRNYRLKRNKSISSLNINVYTPLEECDRNALLKKLNKDPLVEYAEPDVKLYFCGEPDDPSFTDQWALHNTGQEGGTPGVDIDAVRAWDITTGSDEVVVALIDTGVDYTHPDLAPNMWINPGEIAGDGIDNDGNGYIDDIHGIDTNNGGGNPMDDPFFPHGTPNAGVIGAVGNNGIGISGVCWNVKIMALRFKPTESDDPPYGNVSDAITCIEYAIANGANIISCSFIGYDNSTALRDAIAAAGNAGILVVASADNYAMNLDENSLFTPVCLDLDNILSVTSTDRSDQSYTAYGPLSVDVAAPGASVYTTYPGNSYTNWSGTSIATAHVAGIAALIKAQNPGMTWSQIKNRILGTVEPLDSLKGKILTGGRVNAYYAVANIPPPSVMFTNPLNDDFVSGIVPITLNITDVNGIHKVAFYIDGQLKTTLTAPPWIYNWNTVLETYGNHYISVVSYNVKDRSTERSICAVVNNTGLPGVIVLEPAEGAEIVHKTDIRVNAGYGPGLTNVLFYIDSNLIGDLTAPPYEFSWNSLTITNGPHVLTVKAIGSDGKINQKQVNITTVNQFLPQAERDALIAFYNSTDGDNWGTWNGTVNWKKTDDTFDDPGSEYAWLGVTVENSHVVGLHFHANVGSGTIPPDLAALTELKELYLAQNSLTGNIPPELGNLSQLEYFNVDRNQLTGEIPAELGNLCNLKTLYIGANNFSGELPSELGNLTKLEYLYAWGGGFSGSIPPELGNLVNLKEFYANGNQLTGPIPTEFGNLVNLKILDLDYNQLTGSIPMELGNCTQLINLDLCINQLSGSIPPQLGNLTNMDDLSLCFNQLSGEIPVELCNLSKLRILSLQGSGVGGTIPPKISKLGNVFLMNLSGNRLYGSIPPEIVSMRPRLIYFDIKYNALHAEDPAVSNLMDYFHRFAPIPWRDTQTVAPTGVQVEVLSSDSVRLSWSPISFTTAPGHYRIFYGTTPGGPYTLSRETATKSVSSVTLDSLVPGNTYYFVVQALTDAHQYNDKVVESEFSQEVAATGGVYDDLFVNSPNGGEILNAGTVHPITWNTTGPVTEVTIEYSTAGVNGTFIPIANNIANTGLFQWTVPNIDSNQCVMRIADGDGSPVDTSDSVFTIKPISVLELETPNGGERLQAGKPYPITWRSEHMTGEIDIQLYANGTKTVQLGVANVLTGNLTVVIPSGLPLADHYTVRIAQGNVEDFSDSTFSIVTPIVHPDFNSDVKTDLFWRNSNTGENGTWFMNGTTRMGIQLFNSLKTDWVPGGTGDFNSDGKSDIFWHNKITGENGVWIMNGTTRTDIIFLPILRNIDWYCGGLADFNHDGKPDIFWRNNATGENGVWFMDGTIRTGITPVNSLTDTGWTCGGTADFNNDGNPDIFWRHNNTGENGVWFMNGTVRTGYSPVYSLADTDWICAALGDFNDDGHIDILWRHKVTGENGVWFMNGTVRIGQAFLPTLSKTEWEIGN